MSATKKAKASRPRRLAPETFLTIAVPAASGSAALLKWGTILLGRTSPSSRSAALPETALSYRLTTTAGLRAYAKDGALSCQQPRKENSHRVILARSKHF